MKNKFLQGITSFAVATAVCLAFGAVTVSATETTTPGEGTETNPGGDDTKPDTPAASGTENALKQSDIDVDYYSQTITVSSSKDKQIMFGVGTYNKKTSTVKISSWDVYDVEDGVVIDISNLNTQKDNYVQIKGDANSDAVTLHIVPSDTKVKMKYNPVTQKVENNKGSDDSKKYTYEYRTQYGNWYEYGTYDAPSEDVDLSIYQDRGTTLYFRQVAGDPYKTWAADESVKIGEKADPNAYKLENLPGKEIKVAVAKRANGPKVTVNYLKNTVSIPANAKYRVNPKGSLGTGYTAVTSKTDLKDTESAKELTAVLEGGSVDVVTSKEGKADSKITHVSFKAQETVTPSGDINSTAGSTFGSATAKVTKDSKGKLTLEVTNSSTDKNVKYEVVIGDTQPVVATAKGKAAASGKTAKIKVTAGQKIWIHQAGVAKEQVWATEYVQLGAVAAADDDDPKVPEDTTTDQQKLQAVADEYIATSIVLAGGEAGSSVSIAQENKTISGYSDATFSVLNGKTIDGVSITIEVAGDSMSILDTDTSAGLKYGTNGNNSAILGMGAASITATVTVSKADCTPVVVNVTFSAAS